MAQRYDADREPIGGLLTTTSQSIVVPEWQRSYSWDTAQVETFWNDLIAFSERYPGDNITGQEYFLGSIVLVTGGAHNELLDGQQRLATCTILLSVLREARNRYWGDAATRLQTKYIGDYDDATDRTEYTLTLNRYDHEFFRREIQETRTAEWSPPAPTLKSHKRIRDARRFFEQRVSEAMEQFADPATANKWVLRVGKVMLDHMSVVAVSSTDPDNAASVFETLNDRGIGLSTPDLLRNFLLREAGSDADTRARIVSAWELILGVDEEASVDKYLRHYWVSREGDVKNRKLYREIKDKLEESNADPLEFSLALSESAGLYRDLVNGRDDDGELERLLAGVKALGAEPLYPALLAGYAVIDDDKRPLRELAAALITMYIRSAVIGGREAGRIETVAFTTAKNLRESGDFTQAIESLCVFSPSADEFIERFAHATVSRRATAGYLLRQIELAKRATQELAVEAPDRVHVEHIYPQTPLEGQRWANHAAVINRLGNLTLLGKRLNATVKNADFETKKEKAYATSDIVMTKELLEYEAWSAESVNRRQTELASWAFALWRFPDEEPPTATPVESVEDEEPTVAELPEFPDEDAPNDA